MNIEEFKKNFPSMRLSVIPYMNNDMELVRLMFLKKINDNLLDKQVVESIVNKDINIESNFRIVKETVLEILKYERERILIELGLKK